MDEQELINLLEKRIYKHANHKIEKYLQEIAVWISKILLSETKTEITFEFDPPWDSSGQILNTNFPFEISDYETLDSFLENEYNGSSRPSFMSGHGLFHDFYSSELDELTDNWIALQVTETINVLLKENNHLILNYAKLREDEESQSHKTQYKTAEEISQLIYLDDILGDFLVIDYPIELKEFVGKMDITLLFKQGHHQANNELKQEKIARQIREKEQLINQEQAKKFWNYICKLHRVRYQRNIPSKIEKNYYDQFLYPLLKEEFKENEDVLNIRLVGQYMEHKFSNSVYFKLINFE
ncbi:hypothetical protein [Saliterribacillus persicus]|uniref:Uncharacterized protein n=1 Tax=Saliterribacillus persicus TaxID=930114 RepID=A0A368Y6P1_9BACI|nr:hypothetical protein [Saliterribacillus persicus]RCW74996.1 hypothetical protein DFR57_103294 [Saliterribacillus persicus]